MAITFVGSYVGTHAATSAQTVNFSLLRNESNAAPTLLEGDLVLVAVENASTVDRTQAQLTPSGYDPVHTDDFRADSNDSNFLVSEKFMGATPDTSVAIPASNATTAGVAYAIYVFRGVDPTTPMDVTPVVAGAINTGKANAPAITPSTDGAWIVVFGGAAVAAGAVFTNAGDLSNTTNHFRSATITTTTNDANIVGGIKTDWVSGPFDPTIFGGSTTTNTGSWSATTIALRPYIVASGSFTSTEEGNDTAAIDGLVVAPGTSGGLSATETGDDTATLSGTVAFAPITGALTATEAGDDTASVAGIVPVAGTLASSEVGNDIAVIAGIVESAASGGALNATEVGQDAAAISGAVAIAGTLAATDATDTASFGGDTPVSGTLASSESGADTFALSGFVQLSSISGPISATESVTDQSSISGTVLITLNLSASEDGFDSASITNSTVVPQPAQPSGSLVRPRKKFRPVVLFDLPEEEVVLPDLSAKTRLAGLSATLVVAEVVATLSNPVEVRLPKPINAKATLPFTQIETYMRGVNAQSSWNDLPDDELLFILDFILT